VVVTCCRRTVGSQWARASASARARADAVRISGIAPGGSKARRLGRRTPAHSESPKERAFTLWTVKALAKYRSAFEVRRRLVHALYLFSSLRFLGNNPASCLVVLRATRWSFLFCRGHTKYCNNTSAIAYRIKSQGAARAARQRTAGLIRSPKCRSAVCVVSR
jgi:hypothetical protein